MSYDIFQQQPMFGSFTYGKKKTLDDLEKDEKFLEVSERFLESVGEKSDDVFEYLRDSDFNLVSGMSRAMQSGKFTDQQKRDYAYLRSEFDSADLGSLKQFAGLVKDAGIDIVTDPTLIVAAFAAPFTGGTSLAARQGLATTGLQVAKNFVGPTQLAAGALKSQGKQTARKAAAVAGVEAGAWLGLDNHFRQTTELNTDLRKLYSTPELVGSTALGVLTGGIVGGGIQKANLYYSKMNRLYSDDAYLKTEEGSLRDKLYKTLEVADVAKASSIGSATSILDTKAKFSPTTRELGNLIREDFSRGFTTVTRDKVELGHGEMLDNLRSEYHRVFDEATAPIRKTGTFKESDELGVIRLLRGDNPSKYSEEVQQVAKDLEAFFGKIFDDAIDVGLITEERRLASYFPRSWNRKAIEDNRPAFEQKLISEKIVKNNDEASRLVDEMLNKRNELFASHSILLTQSRAFKNLDDNAFEEFLNTDLNTAITYYMNAANTIQHKKSFLLPGLSNKSNVAQFTERWLDPMDAELRAARGQSRGLSRKDRARIIKLYESVTGQVNYFDSGLIQGIYDGTKLANAMAYLPLATVSSLTEAMIPLTKTGASVSGPVKDALAGVREGHKVFVQDIPVLLRKKHKMSDSDIQKEMQQVFMAMDEAFAESTNRLTGEGLQNEVLKKIGRGFFRLNILTPWTKTVQLASFNIGKGLIRENLESLDKLSKEGIDIFNETAARKLTRSEVRNIQKLKSELFDLGIDVQDGLRWLNDGAKTSFGPARKEGVLTGEIEYADDFYKSVIQGAGRFVNEVIMPVGRDRARIPIFMTNPKVDIFTQFLRYPAVFSNTVLKNYIRSTVVNPKVNGAKLGAFALMATNMALATNYWRSNQENKDRIVEEGFSKDDVVKAFQRVGLMGPLEYGVRYGDSIEYTKNPYVSAAGLGGPVMSDIMQLILGRYGLTETLARKAPLIGTKGITETYFGGNLYDELVEKAREIDKETGYLLGIKDRPKERRYTRTYRQFYDRQYAKGGLVEGEDNVPYTKEDPADRVNKYTGKPYSDQMTRLGLNLGGVIAKQVAKGITKKPKGITAYHGSPVDFDYFSTDFLQTGEGVNAFGRGLYFTETEDIAKNYKSNISRQKEMREIYKENDKIKEKYNKIVYKDPSAPGFYSNLKSKLSKEEQKKADSLLSESRKKLQKIAALEDNVEKPTMFPGRMYKVNIQAKSNQLFDWDKTMNKQPVIVQDATLKILNKLSDDELEMFIDATAKYPSWTRDNIGGRKQLISDALIAAQEVTGKEFLTQVNRVSKSSVVEDILFKEGIQGIRYNDGLSRSKAGKKNKNYVIFDARIIDISKKYGITIPAAGKLLMEMDSANKDESRERFNEGGLTEDELLNFILATEDVNLYQDYRKGNLDKIVKAHEGSKRFQEAHGKKDVPTIGGITGSGITQATVGQTVEMVRNRINEERNYLNKTLPEEIRKTIPKNVQDSAVSLIFNVGQGAFKKSKAYQNLAQGNIEGFYKEAFDPNIGFTKITGADGTPRVDEGLVNRRRQELEFAQGLWQDPYKK